MDLMKYSVLCPSGSDPDSSYRADRGGWLRHPFYGFLGLRPFIAQHTAEEHEAFSRWGAGRRSIVEIGVAEGVSALAMRETMSVDGTLYLIDPFHLTRHPMLNFTKRAARRCVGTCDRGKVIWIERFSESAIQDWNTPIDLLVIDGDHNEFAVERDWKDWSPFVKPDGVALFHDARLFEGGWTRPDHGPVKVVTRILKAGINSEWEIADERHSIIVVQRRSKSRQS